MKKIVRSGLIYSVVGAVLILMSGCWDKTEKEVSKDDKNDVVLLSIDKKPVITKSEFYKELGGMIGNMDPALLPKETQRKVLDDLSRFKLIVEVAKREGVEKDPEYKKAYEEQKNRLQELLMTRIYEKKMFDGITVVQSDVKADYETNKAKYLKEPGGVQVVGVSFKDREKAMSFYDRTKGNMSTFESVGKKEKAGKFKEFGRVGPQMPTQQGMVSMVPAPIRESALKLSKLPAVDVVKDGKETWVIYASDKLEAVPYDFEEIKERIENQLKVNKFMELRTKKQEELKKEFVLDVNEEFFKEAKQADGGNQLGLPINKDDSDKSF